MHQHQDLQNMHHNSPSHHYFSKKLIQLAISFSLLSIIFVHPSWLQFFHSFISHFSAFSSHLFTLARDKNYIFLLCNGILVFIAKYSGKSVDNRPSHHLPLPETSPDISQSSQLTENAVMVEVGTNNEDEYESQSEPDGETEHVVYQITDGTVMEEVISENDDHHHDDHDDDDEHTKDESNGWTYEEQIEEENEGEKEEEDEEEEEEEAIAKMSTEELNRKFDEFIRKMKEELRIEAQRQLIVV